MLINEDFVPKRKGSNRLPPGQYEEKDFPVLSLGPTPNIDLTSWKLEVTGLVDNPLSFTLNNIHQLSKEYVTKDIHCVTKWSKFDTHWQGISLDEIMSRAKVRDTATHLIAHSYDEYTTNIPLEDVSNNKAWIGIAYEDEPIPAEHGGPARLLVPHLYFWKSAKWLNKLEFVDRDVPGFWETRGYHNYGDPWQEQRYWND